MKKIVLVIIIFQFCMVFSQNRYDLNDVNNDKSYLYDSITVLAKDSIITDKPIVVIDGKPFRYSDLEDKKLDIYKKDIKSFVTLKKEVGIAMFGEFAEAGVVVLTTFRRKEE